MQLRQTNVFLRHEALDRIKALWVQKFGVSALAIQKLVLIGAGVANLCVILVVQAKNEVL